MQDTLILLRRPLNCTPLRNTRRRTQGGAAVLRLPLSLLRQAAGVAGGCGGATSGASATRCGPLLRQARQLAAQASPQVTPQGARRTPLAGCALRLAPRGLALSRQLHSLPPRHAVPHAGGIDVAAEWSPRRRAFGNALAFLLPASIAGVLAWGFAHPDDQPIGAAATPHQVAVSGEQLVNWSATHSVQPR